MEQTRTPSVFDALGEALSHMRAKLFPFGFAGWVTLGFVSFLENCASGGGSGGGDPFGVQSRGGGGNPARAIEAVVGWVTEHWILVMAALVFVALVTLLFVWLRSRAAFVYIDDVATGRFDLVRPWSQHGPSADSFFGLSLVVAAVSFVGMVSIIAMGVFGGLTASRAEQAGTWAAFAVALLPLVLAFVAVVLIGAIAQVALRDFVAPLQITRGVGAWTAVQAFFSLAGSYPGTFIAYFIVKFFLSIAIGIAALLFGCLTCCIGFLPVLHHTAFQPVYYAERAWSLKLLAQMGEDVFGALAPVSLTAATIVPTSSVPPPPSSPPPPPPDLSPDRTDFTS